MVTPPTQKIDRSKPNSTMNVTVTGSLTGLKDASQISHWEFQLKKKGASTSIIKTVKQKSLSAVSPAVSFDIPNVLVPDKGNYTQSFQTIAKAVFANGSSIHTGATASGDLTDQAVAAPAVDINAHATVNPATQKIDRAQSNSTMKVTLTGELTGLDDPSSIDHWEFEVRKRGQPHRLQKR